MIGKNSKAGSKTAVYHPRLPTSGCHRSWQGSGCFTECSEASILPEGNRHTPSQAQAKVTLVDLHHTPFQLAPWQGPPVPCQEPGPSHLRKEVDKGIGPAPVQPHTSPLSCWRLLFGLDPGFELLACTGDAGALCYLSQAAPQWMRKHEPS